MSQYILLFSTMLLKYVAGTMYIIAGKCTSVNMHLINLASAIVQRDSCGGK